MRPSRLRRSFLASLVAFLLALPTSATWSIVVINRETGEVAVGTATCLANFNIRVFVPVIVVGEGAAAAQSLVDTGAINRRVIYFSMRDTAETPQELLDQVLMGDGFKKNRQYGIVNFDGPPVTYTGDMAGKAATGVTGKFDGYVYAIQGNLLAGNAVVFAAEDALVNTPGDLTQKLMASMQAAREYGGDGRCSCQGPAPSCGSPPPAFEKSAHAGTVVVARIGDVNGGCNGTRGCAKGTYYLTLNVVSAPGDPDPVDTLQERYDNWRAGLTGRPDGILSRVEAAQSMPADGTTVRTVTVRLVDVHGVPLSTGGALVEVATVDGSDPLATPGPVTDHGDGTYSFELAAATETGTDRFVITADDGVERATLYPYLDVRHDAVEPMHLGFDSVSASSGAVVPFVLNEPGRARGPYLILASLSGTSPGYSLGRLFLPLNPDEMFFTTLRSAGDDDVLPGSFGQLDRTGRADAAFIATPGMLSGLEGRRVDWAALLLGRGLPGFAGPVGFDVVP